MRLKASVCNLRTVYNCALSGPFGPLFKGNLRHKMTTIVGNRGQLRTGALSPHLLSPHLDFPKFWHRRIVSFFRFLFAVIFCQGIANPAFSKPCLCLNDTCHFRHFRRFWGSEERNPYFQWRMQVRHFRRFRQNGLFLAGDKEDRFTKNTVCATPILYHFRIELHSSQKLLRNQFRKHYFM